VREVSNISDTSLGENICSEISGTLIYRGVKPRKGQVCWIRNKKGASNWKRLRGRFAAIPFWGIGGLVVSLSGVEGKNLVEVLVEGIDHRLFVQIRIGLDHHGSEA